MKYKNPTAAVYLVSAIAGLSIFGDGLLYSVLPLYASELGIPLAAVGVVLSINRWVRLATNPLAARSFNRYGVYWPLLVTMVLSVITTFIYSRAWGLFVFLTARLVWGLCWSHIRLGGFLVIMDASTAALGFGMGIFHVLTRLGSAFTSSVGSFFVDLWGYKTGLTLIAGLSSVGILLVFALGRIMESSHHAEAPRTGETSGERPARHKPELSPLICNAAGFTNSFVGSGLIVSSLSLILQQRIGDSATLGTVTLGIATISGLVLAMRWASNLVVSPVTGKIIDRMGRRSPFLALVYAMVILLSVFAATRNPVMTVLSACLLFIAGNALEVLLDAAVSDNAWISENRNARISQYTSFYDLGAAVGPIVGYAIGVRFSFTAPFYLGALLMALVIGLYVSERGTQRRAASRVTQ